MRVECEGSTPTSRPLFKERMAGHRWEELGTTASSRWRKLTESHCQVGSADPGVPPAPLWALWLTALARCPPTVVNFEHLGARPNFASKYFQKYFSSKDFNAQKIFLDFCKNIKGDRKKS